MQFQLSSAEASLRTERGRVLTLEQQCSQLHRGVDESSQSLKDQLALERRRAEASRSVHEEKLRELERGRVLATHIDRVTHYLGCSAAKRTGRNRTDGAEVSGCRTAEFSAHL